MAKVRTKDGVGHVVTKKKSDKGIGKKGDIIVDHTATSKGKYDKMNLTKVAKAKTVKEGVAGTRKWHAENPQKKAKKNGK
jgi:hypothetical protein